MKIIPFRGILYNLDKVNIKDVVTLPYDKISPTQKSIYESRNPYNMVHLILPKGYKEAGLLFRKWLKDGLLREDHRQAIYVYEQEYEYPRGNKKIRRGFIALLELKPFGKDTIMPHERTFPKVVENRMNLLDSCKANLEQIFILYNGEDVSGLLNGIPQIDFSDEFGITHRLWSIIDEEIIRSIQDTINSAELFIADGHHRYEASLIYKEKRKEVPGVDYMMATFINSNSSGLTILPTHRVLKEVPGLNDKWLIEKLKEYFIVQKQKGNAQIGIYLGEDNYYTLRFKKDISLEKILGLSRPRAWLYLDVNILHLLILKHIMGIDTQNLEEEKNVIYLREDSEAIDLVKNKKARVVFILNPTKIEQVKEIVSLDEVMPHKSTDFYPKLHSGLVLRKF